MRGFVPYPIPIRFESETLAYPEPGLKTGIFLVNLTKTTFALLRCRPVLRDVVPAGQPGGHPRQGHQRRRRNRGAGSYSPIRHRGSQARITQFFPVLWIRYIFVWIRIRGKNNFYKFLIFIMF